MESNNKKKSFYYTFTNYILFYLMLIATLICFALILIIIICFIFLIFINIVTIFTALWSYEIIYEIKDSNTFDTSAIINSFAILEQETCLRFIKKSKQFNYINIYYDINSTISYTDSLGKNLFFENYIVIGENMLNEEYIIHEILHKLNFNHEHNRYDRNNYIEINWNNIIYSSHKQFYYNFFNVYYEIILLQIPYDYNSIMHYSRYLFAINDTIETIKFKNKYIINYNMLTKYDVEKINLLYC